MTSITIDAATAAKLASASEPVQLCDEAGNVLGWYDPKPIGRTTSIDEVVAKCPTPPEEIQRRVREEVDLARPLKDVWPEIEALGQQNDR